MRVIVCGGRDYSDEATIHDVLSALRPATIVHGDARGADSYVELIAPHYGHKTERHPADWQQHGKAAGPIRNQKMLDAGADLVIAFPGGEGTADMVGRARRSGAPVLEVAA